MTTITTRAGKGSALTYEEADANFTNLKTDVESLQGNITAANAAIVTANTAMKGYVDAQDTAVTSAWTANAGAQADAIAGANAAIVTANTAVKNYVDTQITVTQSWVTGANAAIITANTALKAYVDAQDSAVTTAWTSNAGVQADAIAGANAAIVTANSAVVSFVNMLNSAMASNVAGANAAIVTANTAMKSYVDAVTTAWTANAGAQADAIAGANAAIVTANTALKNYTDSQITTTQSWVTGANAAIVTANTALKSYVDTQDSAVTSAWTSNAGAQADQIAGANAAIVTANTALKAYTDNQITTANTALKSYVDTQDSAVTSAWTSNAGVQADAITALQSNAGAQANQITGANVNIARIDANLGSFQTYANLTFGTSGYANANVASYLPVYGGTINALNITGVPGENLTLEPDGTGNVQINADTLAIGDNNVDATITTRGTGNLLLRTHNADTTEGNITLSHGANGNIKLWPNGSGVVESAKAIVVQGNVTATYLLGDGSKLTGITAGTTYGDSNVATYLAGNVTVGNIASTNGFFWSNGTSYSSTTALGPMSGITSGVFGDAVTVPQITIAANGVATSASNVSIVFPVTSGFSGNLVGNTLTASTTGRILANASPQVNVTQISSYTQGAAVTTTPVYTAGNLTSANQAVAAAFNGNINFLTNFATGTRTTIGALGYLGVTATSANTAMNTGDRIRALVGGLDLNLNGKSWGFLTSASNALTPIAVNGQTLNVYGTGNMGQAAGIATGISITPVAGSINAQYATSNFSSIAYNTAGATYTASNIQYARLYTGSVTATANLTIANVIALHTFSGWTSSNVSLVTNAYTVLNEDTRSTITTAGNINIANNATTTGFIKFAVFTVAQITAVVGSTGQQAAVSNGTGKNNGAMCYWDATNVRWSWVSDDTAVT